MKCPNCGKEIADDSNFCGSCGTKIIAAEKVENSSKQDKDSSGKMMEFSEAIKVCVHKYANAKGRAGRAEFWWFYLFVSGLSTAAYILDLVCGVPVFSLLIFFATVCPTICAGIRRMHDIGKPAGFVFIPVYNIILLAQPSQEGTNAYD